MKRRGKIFFGPNRVGIVGPEYFTNLIEVLAGKLGYGEASRLSYEAFRGAAHKRFERAKSLYSGHKKIVEQFERNVAPALMEMGLFGKIRLLTLEEDSVRLAARDSLFVDSELSYPTCLLTAAILAGAWSTISGVEWECVEKACASMGNDECEFELTEMRQ